MKYTPGPLIPQRTIFYSRSILSSLRETCTLPHCFQLFQIIKPLFYQQIATISQMIPEKVLEIWTTNENSESIFFYNLWHRPKLQFFCKFVTLQRTFLNFIRIYRPLVLVTKNKDNKISGLRQNSYLYLQKTFSNFSIFGSDFHQIYYIKSSIQKRTTNI